MKRMMTAKQYRRWKFMCATTVALLALSILADRVFAQDSRVDGFNYEGPYFWQG